MQFRVVGITYIVCLYERMDVPCLVVCVQLVGVDVVFNSKVLYTTMIFLVVVMHIVIVPCSIIIGGGVVDTVL
jgi:hypothetical protein